MQLDPGFEVEPDVDVMGENVKRGSTIRVDK